MSGKDLAKLAAAAFALYQLYGAYQAYEKNEDPKNSLGLLLAGFGAFTAIEKLA